MITAKEAFEQSSLNALTESKKLEAIWDENKEVIFKKIELDINNSIAAGKFQIRFRLENITPTINKHNYKNFLGLLERDLLLLGFHMKKDEDFIDNNLYVIYWDNIK